MTAEIGSSVKNAPAKNKVDSALVNKATMALLKHHEDSTRKQNGKQLLGTDLAIQVQIGLDRVPQNPSPKPIRVMIPHPLHRVVKSSDGDDSMDDEDEQGLEEPEVCLIVKEESKPWVQEMISNFPEHMGCIKKVLGLQSLRKKHKRYEQRRELLRKYDLFLADDRILPMLAKCIGKNFFQAKKQPIPVRLTRKEALPLAIRNCLRATYMYMSAGTCLTIRAGNTGMPCQKLVDNVEAIAANAVEKVPRKWANVRSISIKTTESTALPVYNKTPEELMEIAEMAGVASQKTRAVIDESKKAQEAKDDKKRKQQQAAKSPLVRALKKQKTEEKERKANEKEAKKKKKPTEAEVQNESETAVGKKKKKKKMSDGDALEMATSKEAKEELDSKTVKATKSKTIRAEGSAADKAEKKRFIPSKKYQGSREGYVFRNGKEGVGYYVDVKPVPDKMAMAALARLASASPRGGKRSKTPKSGGKRRGRR